jgi:hypothetical protein
MDGKKYKTNNGNQYEKIPSRGPIIVIFAASKFPFDHKTNV